LSDGGVVWARPERRIMTVEREGGKRMQKGQPAWVCMRTCMCLDLVERKEQMCLREGEE
jgi:hypothetical protein